MEASDYLIIIDQLSREVTRLKVLLDRERLTYRWTPVSLGLPEKDMAVVARCDRLLGIVCFWGGDYWYGLDGDEIMYTVIDWMPLPPVMNEVQNGGKFEEAKP